MKGRSKWVISGDRSHPNLIKLDGLRLSYPGWIKDFLDAERAHVAGSGFDVELFKLEESQRIHNGDRSHSRLVKLDSLKLSYPGCEQDRKDVERNYHLSKAEQFFVDCMFNNALEGLKNKQRMFQGDRSHPFLKKIDELKLSYPGWEEDFEAAETQHKEGATFAANERLHTLKEKQRIHEGCRSHWRLKKLDSLKLSYPGWQEDVKDAEEYHVDNIDEKYYNIIFKSKLQGMKNKQDMFMGDRSHPNLKSLYELSLTYPGWREDFADALIAHGKGMGYAVKLHKLKEKQRLYAGDRSHWRVVEIDSLDLSYPGWQADIRDLEKKHLDNEESVFENRYFKSIIKGIRNKQMLFMGYSKEIKENDEQHGNGTTNINSTDEENASSLGLCVACMAQPKSCAFVPCGHVSFCESCSSKSMKKTKRCPICRQRVKKFMKIYVS